MLVHSCLYYDMNTSIVSDHTWQEWADELADLISKYPELNEIDRFDSYFQDWTGASGFHFPHRDPWVRYKAKQILAYEEWIAEAAETYARLGLADEVEARQKAEDLFGDPDTDIYSSATTCVVESTMLVCKLIFDSSLHF